MSKSKKWSEQCLVENTFGHNDENGNEVFNKVNCLHVCIGGQSLYRKHFMEEKYKGKNLLRVPFDFIVLGGVPCPRGEFYELEYTIGEYGAVYRALIQAVNPVTDLSLIVGTLKSQNVLPRNFTPCRAWKREDIDAVCVGSCSRDEDGEISFFSGHVEANEGSTEEGGMMSVLDHAVKFPSIGTCLDYYRGDCREVWVPEKCDCEPVFVCGVNGNDEAFAERRHKDMERLNDLLDEAMEIIDDYRLMHCIIIDKSEERDGNKVLDVHVNMTKKFLATLTDSVYKKSDENDNTND